MYNYETMLNLLNMYPENCAQLKGWRPTEFIKSVNLNGITYKVLIKLDTAVKTKNVYHPSAMDKMSNKWMVYNGGKTYGNFDQIRF